MKAHLYIGLFISALISASCNRSQKADETKSGFIEITKAQFASENMALGEPILRTFSESLQFTGSMTPSVNGKAQISLPLAGTIDRIYCAIGQPVNKGQLLIDISGNDLIDMQKDFAESSAILKRLKSEYNRVNELFAENIGTEKELILAESAYKSENARYMALKIKLERIGLDLTKIEDGSFYNSYSVKSPIKGYITNLNATIGQFIEQQFVVLEIVDADQFQIKFSVFEKDMGKLKIGQHITFNLIGDKNKIYAARLSTFGRIINTETKAIDCFAEITDSRNMIAINNQYIEGNINIDSVSVYSLPVDALLESESENYVLSLEKETEKSFYFSKIKVATGALNKDFIELVELPKMNKLLVKGVYNIKLE